MKLVVRERISSRDKPVLGDTIPPTAAAAEAAVFASGEAALASSLGGAAAFVGVPSAGGASSVDTVAGSGSSAVII